MHASRQSRRSERSGWVIAPVGMGLSRKQGNPFQVRRGALVSLVSLSFVCQDAGLHPFLGALVSLVSISFVDQEAGKPILGEQRGL